MTPAVGRLRDAGSGRELGTVFAVNRRLALTALHCVGDRYSGRIRARRVLCSWPEGSSGATVTDHDIVNDVALMRLDRVLPDALEPVPLSRDVVVHDQWSAPGAPAELGELFLSAVSGLVVMPDGFLPGGARGMELLCWESIAGLPLAGLSGAPVLTGTPTKAVGLIR